MDAEMKEDISYYASLKPLLQQKSKIFKHRVSSEYWEQQ